MTDALSLSEGEKDAESLLLELTLNEMEREELLLADEELEMLTVDDRLRLSLSLSDALPETLSVAVVVTLTLSDVEEVIDPLLLKLSLGEGEGEMLPKSDADIEILSVSEMLRLALPLNDALVELLALLVADSLLSS